MVIKRPNKQAMSDALDIFCDAMRPFIVRHLRRVSGRRVEDAIREALRDRQLEEFEENLREGRAVEDSIGINCFPQLVVVVYWQEVFSRVFNRRSDARDIIWMTVKARNQVAHSGSKDMDSEYVRARLTDVSRVLKEINEPGSAKAVEDIRDALFTAAAGTESSNPGVKKSRKERPSAVTAVDDESDQAPKNLAERRFAGYTFERVGAIQPERDKGDGFGENGPESGDFPLHRHGQGPFCRFRVAQGWRETGVYVVTSDGKPLYVGATKNLESVWRSYGRIARSAMGVGGNTTYCRLNNRILKEAKQGAEVILWFCAAADDRRRGELKAELEDRLDPPENRRPSDFPR